MAKSNHATAATANDREDETLDQEDAWEDDENVNLGQDDDEDEFFINFDEVPDANVLVTPGKYEAFIAHAEKLKGTKPPYAPYINLRWKIDDANAVDSGAQGRVIFDSLSWHPNALSICRQKLEGIGFPKGFRGKITTDMLLGERAIINVKTQNPDPSKEGSYDENGDLRPPKSVVRGIKPLKNRTTPKDL